MFATTAALFLVALQSFLSVAFDVVSEELLRLPIKRERKLPDNYKYFNGNEVLLELHNNHNWSYSAEMTVGNPPQKLRMEFDTGSSDMWIAESAVCKAKPTYCKYHRTFNKSASTTYKSVRGQLELPYGSETIDVDIAIDDFEVGGLKIKDQYFGAAYNIETSNDMEKYPDNKDGIFGLSFPKASEIHKTTGRPSALMNLIQQGQLPQPVFAFYLTHPMSENLGELVMGGVDENRYTGDFVFADVISDVSWTITIDGLYYGDEQVGKEFDAIIDSGTSLIAGPPHLINPIRRPTFGDIHNKTSVACTKASELPDVTFVISGHKFVLTPADYIVKEYSNVTCVFGFYPAKDNHSQAVILGNVFMRKFYTLFDVGNRRIGFANASGEQEEDTNSA